MLRLKLGYLLLQYVLCSGPPFALSQSTVILRDEWAKIRKHSEQTGRQVEINTSALFTNA